MPIADPDSSTVGPLSAAAIASEISVVPFVRLSVSSRLYSSVQRLSPMPAPARCTTASTPSSACVSMRHSAGDQTMSVPVGLPRTTRITSWPSDSRWGFRAEPMRPVDPVMATRMTPSVEAIQRIDVAERATGGDWLWCADGD